MTKKYEFTSETIQHSGRTLRRIRHLGTGKLGGFIESKDNLSHFGNCWVSGDAKVSGIAQVSENAQIYGNAEVTIFARVYGNALVCGNAKIYGDAEVYGNTLVYGNAQIYGNAQVYGNAKVYEAAKVFENAQIYESTEVFGNLQVNGFTKIPKSKSIFKGYGLAAHRLTGIEEESNLTQFCICDIKLLASIGCKCGGFQKEQAMKDKNNVQS